MAKKNDKEVQLTYAEKLVNSTNTWLGKHGKVLAIIVAVVVAVIVIASVVTVVVNSSNKKTYEIQLLRKKRPSIAAGVARNVAQFWFG